MKKRKIAIITGTRAEYGLLSWLMQEIKQDHNLELQVIATGMHLSPEFGMTYKLIEADGFKIDAKVEILLSSDSSQGVAKSTGLATISITDTFVQLMPDIVVVLGDRFEILAAAQAAMLMKIPVAHIHGGEVTEGALDESIRHAVTKMAHIHFPVTQRYKDRLIQLGEQPDRIFNYGSPGLDHIKKTKLLTKKALAKELDIQFTELNILVTYHPVTIKRNDAHTGILSLFEAFADLANTTIIFTKSNADEGGRTIGKLIDDYVSEHSHHCKAFDALGLVRYLSLAKAVDIVIGNSSSGLLEVPYVKTPSINIGSRQKGRLIASSVINAAEDASAIRAAIKKAQSIAFQQSLETINTPYGIGDASYKIKQTLKTIQLEDILIKPFYDLPRITSDEQVKDCHYC